MIRSAIKRGIQKVMDKVADTPAEAQAPVKPVARSSAPAEVTPVQAAPPVGEAAPAQAAPVTPADDTVGPPLKIEEVQSILDDMVRPALQGDGGDITLIKVEDNNIYVKLVGSCSTCPSSIMTMKMGVEALLKEEFPSMRELIQVD